MKFAIFTPGAYIWPVHRSFEGFIASLGAPGDCAHSIHESGHYPVAAHARLQSPSLSPRLDARLQRLHREIYDALLRPSETYSGRDTSIEAEFWPDLAGTPPAQLLQGLMFYFLRCGSAGVTVGKGLMVLRALFFNHESAEPEHWLYSAYRRTQAERAKRASLGFSFEGPATARIDDLAFVLCSDVDSAPSGPGMLSGRIRRSGSRLLVQAECGLDPSLQGREAEARGLLEAQARRHVDRLFGWQQEAAA